MSQQILNIISLLACSLMMLFCMRGMFSSKKECHGSKEQVDLTRKIEQLEKQNKKLAKELDYLK